MTKTNTTKSAQPEITLANVFGGSAFTHEVALFVPSTFNVNIPLHPAVKAYFVNKAIETLTGLFGGTTTTSGRGSYVDNSGTTVIESVTIVSAYLTIDNSIDCHEKLQAVRDFAESLKVWLGQESILITVKAVQSVYFI